MKSYKVKARFIRDYLQARFTEDAKKELENYISKGICKTEEDSWRVLLYKDENGIYIPSEQLKGTLVNAGKEFKVKKQKRSMKQWVISNIIIEPEKIYLGKQEPDTIKTSYPARKDGTRVTLRHPSISAGTEFDFVLTTLWDDDMEDKAIKNLLEMAGKMYGIGARRTALYGRFEIIDMKQKK